ncbi:hypothetical protein Leryth_020267 [Lithospermum erythrorhizon]|nr:hypothetical protein Leryth_020267 [Lithospermum erythrorhizon]
MAVKDSANYKPSIWNYDYIQSLNSPYLNETYGERSKKLKGQVKDMLAETSSTFEQLELLDVSSRLGISYHFKYEICQITELIYASLDAQYYPNKTNDDQALDLYATALKFRVLRENGHQVSQEIFRPFLNNNGDLKSSLCKDVKSLLSLYEASYLSLQDESILDLAQDFTVRYLKESLARNECQGHLAILVKHALDLPLNWRMQRLETKWFIKMYEKMESMNPILLELAILDFNMVQAKYQEEIKELSGWYVETGLAEKLPFARDRLFENFLWALAVAPEPQLEHCRKTFTKVAVLILIVDDIYDEYGTLDELELFTDVINRWDITAVNQLPDYMKICFMALFKCVNEVAHDIPTEQGVNVIPCLEKMVKPHNSTSETTYYQAL